MKDSTCASASGHWVAACATACVGTTRLCDPNAQKVQCAVGAQCSTDTTDLEAVGLPGPPYGVCK